ncbi:hypothetical protein [Pantoea sp. CCBC3-3-1]|uniref:hypothetical protein n=1 Tax=Pantoea sp. CCBC3-3-1 TaxID=2490851 RepID=UPI0011BE3C2C|nr:hypothetical protein [Pantoea sp. CCBC3-3-1]
MKKLAFLVLYSAVISGCSSPPHQSANSKQSQYEMDRAKAVKIENSMREQKIKADQELDLKAFNSGCAKHAIESSKQYFSMAKKYYGTNSSTVTETPQSWAMAATEACVSGYDAGVTNQPQSMLDRYLYSIRGVIDNPFQYKAIADSMYWGYGRSIR